MIGGLTNHLWQSTLIAVAAGLLTIAFRKNRAQVRYWLWLCASFKFLLPFTLLLSLGSRLEWAPAPKIARQSVSFTMLQISQPFSRTSHMAPVTRGAHDWVFIVILGVWACGFAGVALMRFRGWLRVLAAVRASKPMDILAAVAVHSSPGLLEPGVVGLFRPILLLPADIMQRLTPRQLEAVLAHELSHVRRRDNLTSAIHMIVEAVFWFYPLVWWISARLVEERERACDEEVLRLGTERRAYAEAILNVCTSYLESPLSSVAGVTGSDLKKRIQAILTGRVPGGLNFGKKVALAAAGMAAFAIPVLVGMMNRPSIRAQSPPPAVEAPSVKLSGRREQLAPGVTSDQARRSPGAPLETLPPAVLNALGTVTPFYTVAVKPHIDGQLISVSFNEGDLVQAGQVLASIDPRPYQIQLAEAESQLAQHQAQLARATLARGAIPNTLLDTVAQLEGSIKNDQANIDSAKLQLTYAQVTAPITGIVGLRLVDPGNIVHAADTTGLLIINQLKPIAVLFNIAAEILPNLLARLKGSSLPVEAWNHARTVKIATGRLTAVDNQIDPATGTVKLKAVFENKDGALFPNQFVVVHLLLNAQ